MYITLKEGRICTIHMGKQFRVSERGTDGGDLKVYVSKCVKRKSIVHKMWIFYLRKILKRLRQSVNLNEEYSKTPQSADFGIEQNCTADCEIRRLRVLLYVVNGTEWCIIQC